MFRGHSKGPGNATILLFGVLLGFLGAKVGFRMPGLERPRYGRRHGPEARASSSATSLMAHASTTTYTTVPPHAPLTPARWPQLWSVTATGASYEGASAALVISNAMATSKGGLLENDSDDKAGHAARCSTLWRKKEEQWRARRAMRQAHVRNVVSSDAWRERLKNVFDPYEPEW